MLQEPNAAPSNEHWKLAPVGFVELKLKVAPVAFVGLFGVAVIVVSGAVVSIVQMYVAGIASVFPAASVAFTWNVWLVAARPL